METTTLASEYRRHEETVFGKDEETNAKGSEALLRKFRFGSPRLSQIQCQYPASLDQERESFAETARTGDRADIWRSETSSEDSAERARHNKQES